MLTHLSVDGVETNLDRLSISRIDVYSKRGGSNILPFYGLSSRYSRLHRTLSRLPRLAAAMQVAISDLRMPLCIGCEGQCSARAQHATPRRYTPMPLILHCPGDHRKRRQACLDPATISVRTASSYTRTRDKLWDRGRGLHMTLECVRRKFARACREPRVLRRALHPSMLSVNIALILHIATDILHLRPASRRICKPMHHVFHSTC